ncbi:MAG: flavodoxin [Oscillospiraceae bacterium]|nr:flavodoxin [Oscillospiraceae bacterium]
MSKILIAYYSRAGENYFGGSMKFVDKGNTEYAAEIIARLTGGELFKIEQKTPYSDNYNECIKQAKSDQKNNLRPELVKYPDSIAEYDTIYLGYPNYWGTLPMAVFTFLERYDFSGKVIRPFCTHEGSGLGGSIGDICAAAPNAAVERGIAIRGSDAPGSEKALKQWI